MVMGFSSTFIGQDSDKLFIKNSGSLSWSSQGLFIITGKIEDIAIKELDILV